MGRKSKKCEFRQEKMSKVAYMNYKKKMIKIKTIVEITGVLLRKDLRPELQKMSLKELRKFVLNHNIETENNIKNALGNLYDVRIKDVVVMESKQ